MMEHDEGKEESNQGGRPPRIGIDFDATQSLTASSWGVSFDYSTSTSEIESGADGEIGSTAYQNKLTDLRAELKQVEKQRDFALEEAREAKKTLSVIMEAIQILCRQMKSTKLEFQELECVPKKSSETTCDNEGCRSTGSLAMDDDKTQPKLPAIDEKLPPPAPTTNRTRTSSGVSTTSIATYTSEDSQRFSELLNQSSNSLDPDLSKIGADLMALNGVCRTIDQNARHISDESSTLLSDLQHVNSKLVITESRCRKAEKCAKKLYNENQIHKNELERIRAERKLLIREIKSLRVDKNNTEVFQTQLVESMKTYETHLKNQLVSKVKPQPPTDGVGVSRLEGKGDSCSTAKVMNHGKDSTMGTLSRKEVTDIGKTPEGKGKNASSGVFNPFGILKSLPFGSSASDSTTKIPSATSTENTNLKEMTKNGGGIEKAEGTNNRDSNENQGSSKSSTDAPKVTTSPTRAPLQIKSTSNTRYAKTYMIKPTVSLEELIGIKSSSSSTSWVRQVNSPTGSSSSSPTGKKAVVKVKVKLPKNKDSKT